MQKLPKTLISLFFLCLAMACKKDKQENNLPDPVTPNGAYKITRNVTYNGTSVDVIIDKPLADTLDVMLLFHGTVTYDSLILQAAENTLNGFRALIERDNIMLVSVAYPEENLLIGDNVQHAEAALLWVKNKAAQELNIKINKIFLAGHSQGGYISTRINTMHATDGVVANAPGPLDLGFRCQLEENGQAPNSVACNLMYITYGGVASNPQAYFARSLLNFTENHQSRLLVFQGLNDSPIQMQNYPVFKQQLENCSNCAEISFMEMPGLGHNALFNSPSAKTVFNEFINE